MSNLIQLLPDHVASQIAAGEVIQRPASVVKELLDNSLDAGSQHIDLFVKDAGKALIQVVDDGCGMSKTDARMCWERHATSKIKSTEDIFHINTMGFRGEALASMASVAQVEMKTRRDEDESGTRILIEGSEVKIQEPVGCLRGTSIAVRNLFFNIPARRNFLKSNPVEYRHIVEEFTRASLSRPDVHFRLFHQDELQLDFSPGTQKERVLQVFSDRTETDIMDFQEQTSIINLNGFVGKPEISRRTRGEQYLFVNKRFFKDNYLNHAINGAFEGLISREQFPTYVVFIEIDPAQIDINVHPTKAEVKFEDEKNVYQILRAVVKRALGAYVNLPENPAFDDNRFMQLDLSRGTPQTDDESVGNRDIKPGNWAGFKEAYQQHREQKRQPWENLFGGIQQNAEQLRKEGNKLDTSISQAEEITDTRVFFQINHQFVVTSIKSGLMLIHQQWAHERVLFERYLQALESTPIASQQLLFPKIVQLKPGDEDILEEILPEMGALGFTVNTFGKDAFVINGLPAELHLQNEQELLADIIDSYRNNRQADMDKNRSVARTLAKKAAIKTGTRLKIEEMNRLVDELFACREPMYSPEGKPCVKKLTLNDIEGLF